MAGGDRERDVEEETRNQMMQNLFGDQSEEEEEEEDEAVEVVDEDDHPRQQQQRLHEADEEEEDDEEDDGHGRSGYHSEEGEGEAENGGEGDAEGEGESEGQVGMEEESEAEAHHADLDQVESDGEKVQSSPERELSDRMMQTDARGMDSEDEAYEQQAVVSRRRGVVASESEGSEDNYYADQAHEDEETRKPSLPMEEERDHEVVRDVFGDSDEDELAPYRAQHEIDEDSHRSPMEDEGHYEKDLHPDDVVADEDMSYESDENCELKPKEKPVGPPLNLVIPLKQPPAQPDRGWLGNGQWSIGRSEMDKNGACRRCGERLVCIDIDPSETENFAKSLTELACKREVKDDFVLFQVQCRILHPHKSWNEQILYVM